ncbi:LamG domain-containing protein, partial [Patescibacteria group bacterium]|nr:LamG domain-containing protein [Patescibacteria group bacterium]
AYTAWSSTGGKFNGGIRFDGDGDYVTGAAGSTLQFGSSDFAIEGWFYSTSNDVGYQGLITFGSTADSQGPVLYIETNNALTFATSNTGSGWTAYITSSTVPSINTWHHIAATRIGSSLKLYMDGTSIEVTQSGTPTTLYASNTMWIGWYGFFPASGQRFFNGTIDDVRIYKGRALSNETIAKHAGNWLMDYSGFNNYGVFDANTTGTTSPYAAYNQSARFGGGFEFDGLDDYMLTPEYNIASTTSSISYNAWIKREGTCNNYNAIISHSPAAGSNGPHFFVGNPTHVNELAVFSGAHYNYTGHVIGTDWTMVTMTFDGSVLKMYADGIEVSSVSTTITSGTEEFTIGGRWGAGNNNYYFNGTIDEVRIYNRTLSPAEINWSAGIMVEDLSWVGNDGFVYGNASYDYYSKFGGAFDFDGVDDYINAGNDTSLNITDAITIEAWIKLNAAGNHPMIVTKGNVLYAAWLNNIFKQPRFALASSDEYISLVSTTVLNLDQWYFLTFTYDKDVGSDNVNIFIDGILTDHMTGTGTINTSATADVYVGRRSDGYYFNGTIDSLRLYNRSLSEEEIRSHYLGTSLQKYQDALVFHTGTADLNYSIADWDEWHHAAATWEEAVSDDSLVLFMKFDNDSVVGEDYYAVEELSNPTAEEGLVLYMKFNNDSAVGEDYAASGSTVYDYSGDGNNGTHYGANYTTSGKIGGGFEFDGVDDYVDVGTKDTFNMEYFTLEFWIKRFGGTNVIAKTGGSAYSNMEWRFSSNIFYVYGASSYSAISGTIPTGTWTHVAAVYDGAPKLYINGVYRGAAASITKNNYNVPVTLGCRNNGGSSYTEYLNGTIDEVKIYSRALSGAEIARSAGTYVHDYSPEGNYGAMLNNDTGTMPTEAGKFDGGMQFDGLDDYINAGNDSSLDITDEITVEAWVYPSASMTDNAIVAKQSSPPGQQYALIIYAAGKARFQVYDTEYREALSDSSLSLNTWHHVVGVYDKSNAIVYVDSVKTVGEAFSGSAQSTSSIVSIGDYSTYDGTYAFNGTIDQVMIYSRALSAQEIQSHYLADYRGGIAKLYIDGVLASDTNFAPGGNDFSGISGPPRPGSKKNRFGPSVRLL